jgi:uncharacterized protein
VVKAGDVVKVKVVEVDVPRKRIGLSMRRDAEAVPDRGGRPPERNARPANTRPPQQEKPRGGGMGSLGDMLNEAMRKGRS